ncbi:MAG: glycoside hydrolase family 88 protein [Bacteroidota bacterium]|nr:glycoside hydrolase family 88 protein [Bacteroidota bacterium]
MNILKKIKMVADWQLQHPVRFDIIFQNIEEQKTERIRMLWDGMLIQRESVNHNTKTRSLPEDWLKFTALNQEDISFCELPQAVQVSLTQHLSLDSTHILQIKMEDNSSRGWEQGTFYAGMYSLSKISEETVYIEALKTIGEANQWKLGPRIYHADDHCIGQLYLDLYNLFKDAEMIKDVQMRFEWIMNHPSMQSIWRKDGTNRWTWCDALFMSPPVWTKMSAITGNKDYIDFMDKEWWATTNHLYDEEEHLFYRDENYFKMRNSNSTKLFWSRGNGWVIAGLSRILEDMPAEYPSRKYYEQLYKEMAKKIASLQSVNGLWNPNLLAHESYPSPEASGSSFFCYALTWGVNNGLLCKDEYLPVIQKAWKGLNSCVQQDGNLGWVQLPKAAPAEVKEEHTSSYGVGAFLLAGSEILKIKKDIKGGFN